MMTSSTSSSATYECPLCGERVDRWSVDTWKEVKGFVGGPKKDHMRLRADTGVYAHDACVKRLSQGQAPGQPSIFETDSLTEMQWKPSEVPEVFDNDNCL